MDKIDYLNKIIDCFSEGANFSIISNLEKLIEKEFEPYKVTTGETASLIQNIAVNIFCELFYFTKHILEIHNEEVINNGHHILLTSIDEIMIRLRNKNLDN